MEILQEMWRKNLGLESEVNVQEWGVYIDSENTGQYDLCYDGWSFLHPHFHYELNLTGSRLSRYLWSNAEYDQLVAEAARAPTTEARNAVYRQLERILAREMPHVPLFFEIQTYLLHPTVRGSPPWPGETLWKHVWLEKEAN